MMTNISYIFDCVDKAGAELVAGTYKNIASHYSPVFCTLVSIYLGLLFLQMKRGKYDFNDFYIIVLRTVIILTIALNYHYFCLFIYDVFTKEPLTICHAITMKAGAVNISSISHALDNYLSAGMEQATKLFAMGSWSNPTYLIFGLLVYFFTFITAGLA